jgi:hypothetical protein
METRQAEAILAEIEEVRQQFESWRNTHAHRSRIPETLWASAVKLARQHGLHRTAKALHLDYAKLKALVRGNSATKRKEAAAPAFVELLGADRLPECVVEMENARGKKMRIHLRGVAAPDVALLSRIFWSSRS